MSCELPTLKIQLYHMKQAMMVALADYNAQLSEHVDRELQCVIDGFDVEELQRVIEGFDFERVVREAAEEAVTTAVKRAVQSYFSAGEGRHAIDAVMREAAKGIMAHGGGRGASDAKC